MNVYANFEKYLPVETINAFEMWCQEFVFRSCLCVPPCHVIAMPCHRRSRHSSAILKQIMVKNKLKVHGIIEHVALYTFEHYNLVGILRNWANSQTEPFAHIFPKCSARLPWKTVQVHTDFWNCFEGCRIHAHHHVGIQLRDWGKGGGGVSRPTPSNVLIFIFHCIVWPNCPQQPPPTVPHPPTPIPFILYLTTRFNIRFNGLRVNIEPFLKSQVLTVSVAPRS